MNQFDRSERIRIIDGKLVRIIRAHGRGKQKGRELDIVRVYDDGKVEARNISCSPISGWVVAFPGIYYRGYCYKEVAKELDFEEFNYYNGFDSCIYPSKSDEKTLLKKHPDFKFILKKHKLTICQIFKVLPNWTQNPKIEYALDIGWFKFSISKKINSLSKEKIKQLIKWRQNNKEAKDPGVNDALTCVKYDLSWGEFSEYKKDFFDYRTDYPTWIYLKDNNIDVSRYKDYLKMNKKAGHKLSEKYWKHPKNFDKQHQKVIEECKRIEEIEEAKRNKEHEKALKKKEKAYLKAIAKLADKRLQKGDYKVFLPKDIITIKEQADKLNQCLISSDYIGKVIEKKCFLVFVHYRNKPLATCELLPVGKEKFKIGQFYGDESKRLYTASKKAVENMHLWANENKIKICQGEKR